MNPTHLTTDVFIKSANPFGDKGIPASYTRFVLPFAYSGKLSELANRNDLWAENQPKTSDPSRSYFTDETSKVLFDQAKYFELEGCSLEPLKYLNRKISFNRPRIVLFEAESSSEDSLLKTGFLILEVYFEDGQKISLDLFLEINELLRYKVKPYDGHSNDLAEKFNSHVAACLKQDVDPQDDEYGHWQGLLNSFFGKPLGKSWDIYADNRTFVWTCAVIKDGGNKLKDAFEADHEDSDSGLNRLHAKDYGHWIKLLNVDKPRSDSKRISEEDFDSSAIHSSTYFEREWADERTYKRWEEWGTFYGFSYHSGAALIPPFQDPDLWKHFGGMYFDMFLLMLYTRVTVFRFSNRLTEISIGATKSENVEENILDWRESFESLRWEFTLFTNLYQFPLISNQQQMIEMYQIARKSLDVEELYNEVKEEVHSNQEYILQRVQQKQSENSLKLAKQSTILTKNSLRLTRLASVGLVFSMALAMLSTTISERIKTWVDSLIPDAMRCGPELSVDWFLLVLYIVLFFLLLKLSVWAWERLRGEKTQ